MATERGACAIAILLVCALSEYTVVHRSYKGTGVDYFLGEAMVPYLDVEPTRSILLRSAASLALECQRSEEAERLACLGLSGKPPVEIRTELRDVLMTMWQPASR